MACSDDCSTIVLGSQDGNVWVLNKEGQIRWKYSAGSWVNGVGVSRDGSVIVAGALDGTVYIMDQNGNLLTKSKTDSVIQQRSVAASGDGKRIVVVDQNTMYGFELVGIPEVTYTETIIPTPQWTATITTPIPVKTTLPETVPSTRKTTLPETTGTPKSSLTPILTILAFAGLYLVIRNNN